MALSPKELDSAMKKGIPVLCDSMEEDIDDVLSCRAELKTITYRPGNNARQDVIAIVANRYRKVGWRVEIRESPDACIILMRD